MIGQLIENENPKIERKMKEPHSGTLSVVGINRSFVL